MASINSETFAARWAEEWNRRDVEAVLQHFHEDIVFTSPTAIAVVGSPTVRGKEALRAYWTAALTQITTLRFTVDHTLWNPERRELAIIYIADIDGVTRRVSENLTFNEDGLVTNAEVFHGVPVN
jgi:SnoaL-like domain